MTNKEIIDYAMKVREFCRTQDDCDDCPFKAENRVQNACGISGNPSFWFNYNYYSVSELIHMDDAPTVARVMEEQGMTEYEKTQVILGRWERLYG